MAREDCATPAAYLICRGPPWKNPPQTRVELQARMSYYVGADHVLGEGVFDYHVESISPRGMFRDHVRGTKQLTSEKANARTASSFPMPACGYKAPAISTTSSAR